MNKEEAIKQIQSGCIVYHESEPEVTFRASMFGILTNTHDLPPDYFQQLPDEGFDLLLFPCPFCGSKDLLIHEEKSKDGTVTWYSIRHIATVGCGVGLLESDKSSLVKKWNHRSNK